MGMRPRIKTKHASVVRSSQAEFGRRGRQRTEVPLTASSMASRRRTEKAGRSSCSRDHGPLGQAHQVVVQRRAPVHSGQPCQAAAAPSERPRRRPRPTGRPQSAWTARPPSAPGRAGAAARGPGPGACPACCPGAADGGKFRSMAGPKRPVRHWARRRRPQQLSAVVSTRLLAPMQSQLTSTCASTASAAFSMKTAMALAAAVQVPRAAGRAQHVTVEVAASRPRCGAGHAECPPD
jgi:hypothetical protein